MPLSTIFFDEYFDSQGSMENYDPDVRLPYRGVADMELLILPSQPDGPTPGEGYGRFVPPTYNCPNCTSVVGTCGTPDARCYFGMSFARPFQNPGVYGQWRHYRFLIRPRGNWNETNDWPTVAGILYYQPGCVVGGNYYWPEYSMYVGPNGEAGFSHWGASIDFPAGTIPFDDWTCVEMAVNPNPDGFTGLCRAWINEALVFDDTYDSTGCGALGGPQGFMAGSWSGSLAGAGKSLDFARLAWADGVITCSRRGGAAETGAPDPDAERCTWDEYDTQCEAIGDCGRIQFQPAGLGREIDGWETFGNGFPLPESGWFKWVAPRSGKFIWRTRGSTLVNEIGVYRHTGATPPPLVAFSDDDAWDPGTTDPFSSAVEIEADAGVEYRIRVATSSAAPTDWIVVSWGPAKPMFADDGLATFDPDERATKTLVAADGTTAGVAIRDAQHATSGGVGAQATLPGIIYGAD